MFGGSSPGNPKIVVGRTDQIMWGLTASHADVSDLYREKVDFERQVYEVDGELRDLTTKSYEIKVKGQEPVIFDLKFTHRGPLIDKSHLSGGQPLFPTKVPLSDETDGVYSFVWGGAYPGESFYEASDLLSDCEDLFCVKRGIQSLKDWRAPPVSWLMADR